VYYSFWNVGGPGTSQRHRCMMVPELTGNFLKDMRIMVIHSQYDLFQLANLGLTDPTAENRFVDSSAFVSSAIAYVESFGAATRQSSADAASRPLDAHYFYTPACGQNGYILPTSIQKIDPTRIKVAKAGEIEVRFDITTWEDISIGATSVQKAVTNWILGSGRFFVADPGENLPEGHKTDTCNGFLCNPTCRDRVWPFTLTYLIPPCARNVVLAYCFLMMGSLWLAFIWAYYNIKRYRYRTRLYWDAVRLGKPLPNLGISKSRIREARGVLTVQEAVGNLTETSFVPAAAPVRIAPSDDKGSSNNNNTGGGGGFGSSSPQSMINSPSVAAHAATGIMMEEEDPDAVDLVALAEMLSSPNKAERVAAKKAYKIHQKKAADRRKQAEKTAVQKAYEAAEKEAQKLHRERQAALGGGKAKDTNKTAPDTPKNGDSVSTSTAEETSKPDPGTSDVTARALQKRAEDELLIEAATQEYRKVHLMVRDLSYWAPPRKHVGRIKKLVNSLQGSRYKPEPGTTRYQILRNVNIAVKPGQVHALMGPSGCGKSTLLDILALIRDSGEMAGGHYINGVRSHAAEAYFLREWLKNNVSYVKQQDVLFPKMTVRQHLTHAAWLLLPEFMSDLNKLKRVSQIISLLGLEECADTICGDGGIKIQGGISGGQRRRVSVATQLLRLPAALVLDEPTSGLDSTNALMLVKSLHTLAHRGGLTVLMTIHQPRNEIFSLFDALTILVAGKVVFSGLPTEAAEHFELPRTEANVSNEILDKLAIASTTEIETFLHKYENGRLGRTVLGEMRQELTTFTSQMAEDLQVVLRETSLGEGRWSWNEASSTSTQMWVLMSRTMRRGGFDVRKTAVLAVFGGIVVGICFVGIGTFTSRTAMCYLGVSTMTFLQGAFLGDRYLAEKEMYDHESSAGSAVSWQAFLAAQFVRDSVTSTTEALCFGAPVYWIGGMNQNPERFPLYLLCLIMIAFVCISSNVMVEVDRDNLRAAALVNVAYVGLGALFNGFIIRIKDLPVYLSWLPYLMVTYWGFVGIILNDFAGERFGCDASVLECATRTGDVVLVALSFEKLDTYVCLLALIGIAFLFRSITIIDFYARYVRGKGTGLKLIDGGTTLEKDKSDGLVAASGTPAATAMRTMLEKKGETGRAMVDEQKKKADEATARINAEGGGAALQFQDEWAHAQITAENANNWSVAAKESKFVQWMLSRPLMFGIFIVDFGALGVVCAISYERYYILYIFLIESVLVCLWFVGQFLTSVVRLIPITPNGPRDCTWAGLSDFLTILAIVGDFVLMIQLFLSPAFGPASVTQDAVQQADSQYLFLILAGIQRGTRLLRLYNYSYKLGRYHQIRADAWLIFADQIKQDKAVGMATAAADPYAQFRDPNATPAQIATSRTNQVTPTDANIQHMAVATTTTTTTGRMNPSPGNSQERYGTGLPPSNSQERQGNVPARMAPIVPPRSMRLNPQAVFGNAWGSHQAAVNQGLVVQRPTVNPDDFLTPVKPPTINPDDF
jgi:ABC-type multidrug transport system ATPase subunit